MEPISDTQHVNNGELTVSPKADIFISYASEAEEWAEKLVGLLLRPGSQVDRATVDGTNRTDVARRASGKGGYAGVVVLITPGYVRAPGVQSEHSTFIEGGVQGAPVYGIRLAGRSIEQLWMPRGLEVTLLPRDGTPIFESEDPDTLLAQIAAEILAGVDRGLTGLEARQGSGDAWGPPSASESSGAPDP
ncbi:MAG TPA: toll/interleukin-1 receptor domain-containing protein, partial [Longimicrobium sp.]